MVMVGVSLYPADNPATIAWTRGYWAELHPYAGGGAYINMMMDAVDEGQELGAPPTASTTSVWPRSRGSTTRITCSGLARPSNPHSHLH